MDCEPKIVNYTVAFSDVTWEQAVARHRAFFSALPPEEQSRRRAEALATRERWQKLSEDSLAALARDLARLT
jgi:hypothetical protein